MSSYKSILGRVLGICITYFIVAWRFALYFVSKVFWEPSVELTENFNQKSCNLCCSMRFKPSDNMEGEIDLLSRPTIQAGIDHYFHTHIPSVRDYLSKSRKTKQLQMIILLTFGSGREDHWCIGKLRFSTITYFINQYNLRINWFNLELY